MPATDTGWLFSLATPVGFTVRTSTRYWQNIVAKRPDLQERLEAVKQTFSAPAEVRQSRRDPSVLLFYTRAGRYWLVAVARRLDGQGFLVTAYRTDTMTDTMKEGEQLWPK
jgi:hypothetical protein